MSLTLASLVPLLIQSGPTLIRSIGGLFGTKGQEAANATAKIVESVAGLDPKAAQAEAAYQLSQLPPETISQIEGFKVQLEKIEADREKNRFDFDLGVHQQTQQTIQEGDKATDEYVRRTRPKMARGSFYAGVTYVFLFTLLDALTEKSFPIDPYILGVILTPAWLYIGARTADGFSKWKTGGFGFGKG